MLISFYLQQEMKIIISTILLFLIACTNNNLKRKYEAFWYETYFVLELENNKFELQYEGHLGNESIRGKYDIAKYNLSNLSIKSNKR